MKEILIHIFESVQEKGFVFDVYKDEKSLEEGDDSIDGGICTGTIEDALGMACEAAENALKVGKEKI